VADQTSLQTPGSIIEEGKDPLGKRIKDMPWWFFTIVLIAIWAAFIILANDFLFSLDLSYVEALDAGQVTDQLIGEFEKYDVNISDKAELTIQRPGEKWKIIDGRRTFILEVEDGTLNVITRGEYGQAFDFIKIGISVTIRTSLIAYGIALVFGLFAGLGRISSNVVFNNLARLYVELVRGIPMLVLIFFIALVGVPALVDGLNSLGFWFQDKGINIFGNMLTSFTNKNIEMNVRAIIALAVTYGAFLAEIFRAGIQSITRGQMEAARSLGMSYGQAMRYVILPQAVRNVLPALGNDFVAMVKDSSLVSVLAVRDITQVSRLYAGSTFRFKESYITLSVMYLTMTVLLSLLVQLIERRLRAND
jgi:polar amino acid transport system permease protein